MAWNKQNESKQEHTGVGRTTTEFDIYFGFLPFKMKWPAPKDLVKSTGVSYFFLDLMKKETKI